MSIPRVVLEDESLRDGLQFENAVVSLEDKLAIFELLRKAGLRRIQVGSFVNPKIVPQMADTDELVRRTRQTQGTVVTGLVLNAKGLERAAACGLGHVSLSASVSDTHSMKNVRKSAGEAITSIVRLIEQARAAGISVRAGAQCAFGCVYEGAVSEDKVVVALTRMAQAGARELNLADTTGMANPLQVRRLVSKVAGAVPAASLSLHLHDTRGLGMANMIAGYEAGVRIFDTSAGGLGGCPFVIGAAGNVPTEDAVHMFESMGIETGIDLQRMCEVVAYYENVLGKPLPGRMSRVLKSQAACAA
jgi:hydroxymethylglutaryl-CoA lyase